MELLGEKTKEDNVKEKPKKVRTKVFNKILIILKDVKQETEKKEEKEKEKEEKETVHVVFPTPQENKQVKPELLEAHLKATGGNVLTRFPPEPNVIQYIQAFLPS